jgi:hypothetical protein
MFLGEFEWTGHSSMTARHGVACFLIIMAGFTTAVAAAPKCKGNPKVIGACYALHGRLSRGADTVGLRLWPVGSERMLGVTGGPTLDDADSPIWPPELKFTSGDEDIYADFEVCPFTPERKGAMQLVCIESATHVVVKRAPPAKERR